MGKLKQASKFLLQRSTRRTRRTIEALFDAAYYLEQIPEGQSAPTSPLQHYLENGWKSGFNPSPLFDGQWYLSSYPDVAEANIDPFSHYIEAGASEGRNPHPLFESRWYLEQHPDVKAAGINPLLHFLTHGAGEKRDPSPYFSTRAYFWQNPDATEATTPLHHLAQHGEVSAFLDLKGQAASMNTGGNSNAKIYNSAEARETPAISLKDLSRLGKPIFYEDLPREIVAEIGAATEGDVPLISIVTPTWNRRHTIQRAIDSVTAQSYQNFEILLSDDGSNDGTLDFVRHQYQSLVSSGKLKIIENQHGGVSAARNSALKEAKGEIVSYLDSDNAWHPFTLAVYAAAFKSNSDIFSVYTPISLIDEDEIKQESNDLVNDDSHTSIRKIIGSPYDRTALLRSNFIDLNGFAHRRQLYEESGGFNENLRRLVDWDLIIRLTKDNPVFYAPVVSTDYYLNKQEIANITHTEPLKENYEKILRIHRREMLERNVLSVTNAVSMFALDDFSDPGTLSLYKNTQPFELQSSTRLAVIFDKDQLPEFEIESFKKRYWFVENVYFKHGGHYQLPTGEQSPFPNEPTVYYPTSYHAMLGPSALYNALLSICLGSLDVCVISHRGHEKKNAPKIFGKFIRDQLVASGRAARHWLSNQSLTTDIVGRILRLETNRFGEEVQGRSINQALQGIFNTDKECAVFWSSDCKRRPIISAENTRNFPRLQNNKPPVATFGMKVAVGGVERLSLSVAKELRESYLALYIALEPTLHAQGTIASDIENDTDILFEVFEVIGREGFPEFFKFLHDLYDPKMIFIMNGSMWLAANAKIVRDSFPNSGIVDQQVYDHEVGWIGHYGNPDIQTFDRFIAVNTKIYDAFKELELDLSKVDKIHHAIDTDRVLRSMETLSKEDSCKLYDLPTDKFVTIFAGRLTEQKRPLDFLKHAKSRRSHDDELFILLGDGILSEECKHYVATHKLQNVVSIPFVEDISTIFRAADILLMTSEYEALPLVVVEAVCMGLPVLATDVGEIKAVVENFGGGIADNSPGDLQELESQFITLRKDYPAIQGKATSNSANAREHFSIRNVALLYEKAGLKAAAQRSTINSR